MKYVTDKSKSDKNSLTDLPSGGSFDDLVSFKGDKEIDDKTNTPYYATVYDPTCGYGSLLLSHADAEPHGLTIYGQEKDNATWALAKKQPARLEYIVVHEMAHFHERTHNARFVELRDKDLPNWHATKDELSGAPLAEEEWS